MKATKNEKILLGILGAILVVILYKQFVFTPLAQKFSEEKTVRDETKQKYDEAMTAVNNLEANKEDLKILKANIVNKSAGFYPCILQEKVILELDTLLEESGLNGNIAFSPIEVTAVSKLISGYEGTVEDSFQKAVDEYQEINEYDGEDEIPVIGNSVEENSAESSASETSDEGDNTGYSNIEQLKVAISFSGTYEALSDFIASINNYSRTLSITDTSISASSDSEVTGTLNLEFYAVPKINKEDSASYLKWDLNNVYGKESPFSEAAATGAYASTIEQLSEKAAKNDFVMMVKSANSEFPALTMGSANDAARETYIYSDKDSIQEVKIEFTEDDGKLFYKYNTEDSVYPKNEDAKEFNTISDDIVIEITSEARMNNDSTGIKLAVVNDTSKKVKVTIKDDDKQNPRVSVTSEGGIVNVTKN